jgi:uncharacterized protein (DUF2235 family)
MRRIVLLSDGTGNAASSIWRSNVWRIFESLERQQDDQIVLYDDGLGTSSPFPFSLLGLMFGRGLQKNVLHFYKFLCRTYVDGDEIYAFGFSRGAFTIRIVLGMAASQGLVEFSTEQELDGRAKAAYKAFRYRVAPSSIMSRLLFPLRIVINRFTNSTYDPTAVRPIKEIRFVGLWDTVAAYGLPVEEMARGLSYYYSALGQTGQQLSPNVRRACHALALDEERTTFQPVLWDERSENSQERDTITAAQHTRDERISQVWFSGVHANVGGGYPDDSLAHVSLCWMMEEAAECGLKFKAHPESEPDALKSKRSMQDRSGRLYDSRKGPGRLYRYKPRNVYDLWSRAAPDGQVPKIHHSVFDRISSGTDQYVPLGIPARYKIVKPDRSIITKCESDQDAAERTDAQEWAWNLVWWRRVVFVTTWVSLLGLIAYPQLFSFSASSEYLSPLRWMSDLVRLAGSVLPDFAAPWIITYARSPGIFVAFLVTVSACLNIDTILKRRIEDQMRDAWKRPARTDFQKSSSESLTYRFRNNTAVLWLSRTTKNHVAPILYATAYGIFFVYFAAVIINRTTFLYRDSIGQFCRGKSSPLSRELPQQFGLNGETSITFPMDSLCFGTGVFLRAGERYSIVVVDAEPPTVWRPLSLLTTPFKRVWNRPWFRIIAQIGESGSEQEYLDADPDFSVDRINEVIRPTRSGELFLYINDVVISFPGLESAGFRTGIGSAHVTIKPMRRN